MKNLPFDYTLGHPGDGRWKENYNAYVESDMSQLLYGFSNQNYNMNCYSDVLCCGFC
jgi:hypothetical protein